MTFNASLSRGLKNRGLTFEKSRLHKIEFLLEMFTLSDDICQSRSDLFYHFQRPPGEDCMITIKVIKCQCSIYKSKLQVPLRLAAKENLTDFHSIFQYGRKTDRGGSQQKHFLNPVDTDTLCVKDMGSKDRSVGLHFTLNQILSLSSDSLPLDYVILAGDITIRATSK